MCSHIKFIYLIVIVGLASCSQFPSIPSSTTSTSELIIAATATPTHTLSATATSSAKSSSTPTTFISQTPTPFHTLSPVYPEVQKICPVNRFVPINELGIDPRIRLLVIPWTAEIGDEVGYSLIDPNDGIPQSVPNLIPNGSANLLSRYETSPDGRWVIYTLYDKALLASRNVWEKTVWVSSLDGKEKWIIGQPGEHTGGTWLTSQKALLYGPNDGQNSNKFPDYEYLTVINAFTMQYIRYPQLMESSVDTHYRRYFYISDTLYKLYYATTRFDGVGNPLYRYGLVDYTTQLDREVFQWITAENILYESRSSFAKPHGLFIVTVDRDYGFDLSPELNLDEIVADRQYGQIMRPVVLQADFLPASPIDLHPTNRFLTIRVSDAVAEDLSTTDRFIVLDYENWIIKDYCFEGSNEWSYSPDGKFVAFIFEYLPSPQPVPKSIFILNLETGYLTQIDDWQFVGWGREEN